MAGGKMNKDTIGVSYFGDNINGFEDLLFLQTNDQSLEDIQAAVTNLQKEVNEVLVFVGAISKDRLEWAEMVTRVFLGKLPSVTFCFYICDCSWKQHFIPKELRRDGQSRRKIWDKESCELCAERDLLRKG